MSTKSLYIIQCYRRLDNRKMQVLTECTDRQHSNFIDLLLDCEFLLKNITIIDFRQNLHKDYPTFMLHSTELNVHCKSIKNNYEKAKEKERKKKKGK